MQLPTGPAVLRGTRIATRHAQQWRCSECLGSSLRAGPQFSQLRPFNDSSRKNSSAWAAAVSVAGNIVSNAITSAKRGEMPSIDPLRIVAKEMKFLTGNIRKLLGSG